MEKESIVIPMLISLCIIWCFSLIDLAIDYETLHDEKEALEEVIEMKNNKINELKESENKLFEELELVKIERGY